MTWLGRLLVYAALSVWSAVCVVPLAWLAIASVKNVNDFDGPPRYLPFVDFQPTLAAWRFILTDSYDNLVLQFFNSLVVSMAATIIALLAAAMFVYALTRLHHSGRWLPPHVVLLLVYASRLLPPIVLVIPLYMMSIQANLLDTRTMLVAVYGAINLPVAVWLLVPVFGPRATDLEEAALLEGASHANILFAILFPVMRASLAAAGLLIFILCWNEYLFAAYLTSSRAATLAPWMVGQLSMKEAQVGGGAEEVAQLSAAAIFMAAPAVLISLVIHRRLSQAVSLR